MTSLIVPSKVLRTPFFPYQSTKGFVTYHRAKNSETLVNTPQVIKAIATSI